MKRARVRVARGAKQFPLVLHNHKFTTLVAHQVCSIKQCLVVAVFHAESFGQMECMVTACVEGELVGWRIRQQQEEFCYLVQNGKIGPHHDGLYCTQMAQTSIVVLRRCLSLRRSRDPQLMKRR
jgi:hypothetical protein